KGDQASHEHCAGAGLGRAPFKRHKKDEQRNYGKCCQNPMKQVDWNGCLAHHAPSFISLDFSSYVERPISENSQTDDRPFFLCRKLKILEAIFVMRYGSIKRFIRHR